jgi:hypothetical protein
VIVCGLAWKVRPLDSRTIDEKLAAIDAEFAIPDSENAAVHYRRFLTMTETEAELLDHVQAYYREPWTDDEYPEEAAAIDKHRALIQKWLDVTQIDKARFSVDPSSRLGFLRAAGGIHAAIRVFTWVAANDLAEGRLDAACDKYRRQMQVVRHILQNPSNRAKREGRLHERTVCRNIRMAAMHDEITPDYLGTLESILEIPMDRGDEFGEITARVDRLLDVRDRSKMSMVERLKHLWYGSKKRREREESWQEMRLSAEANRRATIVLIALRRHKERTGAWPKSLKQIEPKLPAEMLIDPRSDGPFAYRLSGDGFVFCSAREPSSPADNYVIWPYKPRKYIPAREREDP